jgi:Uma2 family endonuclease
VTVEELLTLPDDGYMYEVVEGVLVRVAGSGKQATELAAYLLIQLGAYVYAHRLGRVSGAGGVYKFPGAETGLIPDLAFYTASREAEAPDDAKPIPFAPDLAVEVVSPDQSADGMAAKARKYLRAGTRLVWVVWPQAKHIDVWRHEVFTAPVSTLNVGDALDGEDVIPGFGYSVAELFRNPLGLEPAQE